MKKFILLCVLAFAAVLSAEAQDFTPQWPLSGTVSQSSLLPA